MGGRILTLHLNYVADYTGPLLFLFEQTHNYSVDNQGLLPWRLRRAGRSKERERERERKTEKERKRVRERER